MDFATVKVIRSGYKFDEYDKIVQCGKYKGKIIRLDNKSQTEFCLTKSLNKLKKT